MTSGPFPLTAAPWPDAAPLIPACPRILAALQRADLYGDERDQETTRLVETVRRILADEPRTNHATAGNNEPAEGTAQNPTSQPGTAQYLPAATQANSPSSTPKAASHAPNPTWP